MSRMRCYQINGFGGSIEAADVELPALEGTSVRLKVLAAGLCHSDVHICEGHYDLGGGRKISFADRIKFPRTLGHEVSGEVVELGPDAKGVSIGNTCLICSWIGCGTCEQCAQGLENLCINPQFMGVNRDGGFAEFVDVPHSRYLIELGDLDPIAAAPMVCSGLTTYSALKKFGPFEGRRPVVIIGAGGLGLIAISIAKMLGSAGVVVVELDAAKRKAALDAGAKAVIAPCDQALDEIKTAVGGPVWAVLDLVGSGSTAKLGIDVLDKTGKLVIVGLFGGAVDLPVPTIPLKVLTIQGSYTGSPAELREFVELAREKGLPAAPLDKRPLSAAPAALQDLKAGRVVGRVVLQP